jgi:hypothetical protein
VLLTDLKTRLENLPEKRKRKELNGRVSTFIEKVNQAHAKLETWWQRRSFAQVVFPDEPLKKVEEAVRRSAKQARNLKDKLVEAFDEVSTPATENKITQIGERAATAESEIKKTWCSLFQQQIQPYEALAQVVADKLTGAEKLPELLSRLRGRLDSPPQSEVDGETVRADLEALRQSVKSLGLEGAVGRFIVQAANDNADPQDLFDPEIRNYFEERELWSLLRVSLK